MVMMVQGSNNDYQRRCQIIHGPSRSTGVKFKQTKDSLPDVEDRRMWVNNIEAVVIGMPAAMVSYVVDVSVVLV
jgi:hypothetical protein